MEEKQLKYYKMHHDLEEQIRPGRTARRGIVCLRRTNWRLLIR